MNSDRGYRPKSVSKQGILGQRGVNLIEEVALSMRATWTPTGSNEVGIDGYMELFDPVSGGALGKIIAVQSKATGQFLNETDSTFDFRCEKRDIDYWFNINIAVILVVSKPDSNTAYWVSIKEHFSRPENQNSTKISFNKNSQAFTTTCLPELIKLSSSKTKAIYLPPPPKPEKLFSNLLTLESYPDSVYVGQTDKRTPADVWTSLRAAGGAPGGAWILREKQIISFHDLSGNPWLSICDRGSVEEFGSDEWLETDDADRLRQAVQLLNLTLKSQLPRRVRFWPREECYAFSGTLEEGTVKVPYDALKRTSKIAAVSKFSQKAKKTGIIYEHLRHLAFRGQFKQLARNWYLEITPTYRFTRDGLALDRFHEDRLKTIKRMEGNRAVLSAVMFWANQLRPHNDLIDSYQQLLRFGELKTFGLTSGIHDAEWSKKGEDGLEVDANTIAQELLPFDHLSIEDEQ